jgi:RHS repeat-associated protein
MLGAEPQRENREATGQESYGRFLDNMFRTYDPATGRYLEADPVGQKGGVNLYAYVASNPVNFFDPLALIKLKVKNRSQSERIIRTVNEHAKGGGGKFPLSEILALAGVPEEARKRIDEARGDIVLSNCEPVPNSDRTKGIFENKGAPIEEKLEDVPLPISIILDTEVRGDFTSSDQELDLTNIDGLEVGIPGPNPDIDSIRVTPEYVDIDF